MIHKRIQIYKAKEILILSIIRIQIIVYFNDAFHKLVASNYY